MKQVWACFMVLMLTMVASSAAEGEGRWVTNLAEAQKIAVKEKKDILVNFTGSDWCVWCIRLKKEVFSQPGFAAAAEDFVLVEIDFPQNTPQAADVKKLNRALAGQYGIEGYPTVLLMNANGEVYAKTGYQAGGAEKYVQQLLELKKNKAVKAAK
jgi:thioredoxin-related protein